MSGWLIGLVTLIYLGVAAAYYSEDNTGMCICFVGYAIANVGIILATTRL